MNIENARITNVSITMEGYGCLTFYLTLEGKGWGTCYGGFAIGHGYLGAETFTSENGGGLVAMMKIMDTVGVSRWEYLEGKFVRVETEGRCGSKINVIGNVIEDKWFNISDFFANYRYTEE